MAAVAQGQSQACYACFWMCRNSEVKDQAGKCRHSVSPKIIEPWNRFYSTRCPALSTSSCYRQGSFLLPGWDDSSELGTSRFLTAAGAPLPILDRFCDFGKGKEVAWLVQAGCSHIALQHLCQKDSTSRWLAGDCTWHRTGLASLMQDTVQTALLCLAVPGSGAHSLRLVQQTGHQ